jgi:TetR/AcrR family transcriptional regulator, regulator of cefoperazone and chloramphenicol sensitivity
MARHGKAGQREPSAAGGAGERRVRASVRSRPARTRSKTDRIHHSHGERVRARLIEVAGRLFAERGSHAATGQQICRRAGVHSAAIVYHFGGMQGLYRAVLAEAQRRLVTTQALVSAVASERSAERKLEAFLGLIVRALMSPASSSWAGKLFGREFITPSAVYGRPHERLLAARAAILRSLVSALSGRQRGEPAVGFACLSIMAPCAVMLLFDRRKLRRLLRVRFPPAEGAEAVTRHLMRFALAGIGALRRRG